MTGTPWAIPLLLAALGALHLLLRRLGPAGARGRRLRVVESCALGARKQLHLVEVEGRRLLLGASESGVALLESLPPVEAPDLPNEDSRRAEAAPFVVAEPSASAPPRQPRSLEAGGWRRRLRAGAGLSLLLAAGLALIAEPAGAQQADSGLVLSLSGAGERGEIAPALEVLALLTIVSIAPSILLMTTCFTRIVIVLAFVRQAVGVQHLPPNQVLVGLALFLTFFVMAPLGERIRSEAYEPYVAEEISLQEAAQRGLAPIRLFLMKHTREADLALFVELSAGAAGDEATGEADADALELEEVPTTTLLPAFLISELRTAFEIGFMVFLPFLVIDLVISSMLISMGMIVLPPIVVALPFKIMLFVLADGWNLILGSLVEGLR